MGEKSFENPQTANLCKLLWNCKLIHELLNCLKEPVNEETYVPVTLTSTSSFQVKSYCLLLRFFGDYFFLFVMFLFLVNLCLKLTYFFAFQKKAGFKTVPGSTHKEQLQIA